MNHKRLRPKNVRAGCLMCKPHKMNGAKGGFNAQTRQEQKAIELDRMREAGLVYDDGGRVDRRSMLEWLF